WSASIFFFSSRRRHTRFSRDWSSDVCSSDLTKGSYYGADVAGPVFKRLAQKIYTDNPSLNQVEDVNQPLEKVTRDYESYYTKVQHNATQMPDVRGLPAMDAVPILENLGLKVHINGLGKVKRQSVQAGEQIKKNQVIILELG